MLSAYRSELSWLSQSDFVVRRAEINGVALGGGFGAGRCLRSAQASPSRHARPTETGLGIIPARAARQRLARLIGEARALDLVLTQRRVDANEALSLGL